MGRDERFLIVRYGGIGNTLVSVPAVRALRKAYPSSYISMLVDHRGWEILEGCPYVNERILYDKDRSDPGFVRLVLKLRKMGFTTSIHFKRFKRSEMIGFLAGARERVGYRTQGTKSWFLTTEVPYAEGKNIIDLNLDLVRAMGVRTDDLRLEIWPTEGDRRSVDDFLEALGLADRRVIVIHPGAATLRQCLWGEERFSRLGDTLSSDFGCRILLMGGPEERGMMERIAALMIHKPALAPPLSIRGSAELIRRCTLFVGMDSGPSHLADAVGTPGIVIFRDSAGGAAEITKWKPLGPRYIPLVSVSSVDEAVKAASSLLS